MAKSVSEYVFPEGQRRFVERMRQPFVVCQFLEQGVTTLAISDGFCELFGYEDREQAYADMNRNMFKNVHPEDTAGFTNSLLRFGTCDERVEIVYRTKSRTTPGYRVIHLTGEWRVVEDGVRLAEVWFTDEGDYNAENEEELNQEINRAVRRENLENVVRYDYLTGLPNLSYFFELAEVSRKLILDEGGMPALLYIDLCGMKHFNHKYGFAEGDRMLRGFAQLLGSVFHPEHCCHVSADRFTAVTDERVLKDLLDRLFSQWRKMGEGKYLPIRVGIYPNRVEEVAVGMACDRAKIACDAIRGTFESSSNVFSKELHELIAKRQYILDNLDAALENDWIQVFYQPIVRAINGKVCDEECLARWIDPEKGFLSPADFIPYLEDAGLIYKLDLHVLEKSLEHIKAEEAEGLYVVPHSLNLSRTDFDACDMVEEIRRRVDAAGVARDRISIEITESSIGSDFDFMKDQIERFQALGFPVWMDDFGSGYSSLDVLQSIKFNLIKFDMGFMRKIDESEGVRTILTHLMKMALALGIDTICEGVETRDQVRFLQEIGCSKLQGFFFSRPKSFADTLADHRAHKLAGYENPEESPYFGLVGGMNLYDLSVIMRDDMSTLQNTYDTLPMCVVEVRDGCARFTRTNQSYRRFAKRFFDLDLSTLGPEFVAYDAPFMRNLVRTCCEQGTRSFYDEKMPDGSIVHSFARRIAENPLDGTMAIAIAVLSIRDSGEKLMIEQFLTVIETFGERMPGGFFVYRADETERLLYANKAVCDIFGCASLDEFKDLTGFTFKGMVHPDDYDTISASIDRQVEESQSDLDFVEYRIIRKDGQVRWVDDYGHYIEYDDQNSLYYVFISDVTDKYEQAQSDKARHNAVTEALTKAYDSIWLITDTETEAFELFRIDSELEHLIPASTAVKIERYSQALAFYSRLVVDEDRERFLADVTPENIVKNTKNRLMYSVPFRRQFEDGIRYYRVEFTHVDLPDGTSCIVGAFKDVDEDVRRDLKIQDSINQHTAVIEALGRSYNSVWIIHDMESETFELYRVDEDDSHSIPTQEATRIPRFTDAFANFANLVIPEDRQRFLDAVRPDKIIENTQDMATYSVPFRRVFDSGIRYYQVEFSKLNLGSGQVKVVVGFKDVDDKVRKVREAQGT